MAADAKVAQKILSVAAVKAGFSSLDDAIVHFGIDRSSPSFVADVALSIRDYKSQKMSLGSGECSCQSPAVVLDPADNDTLLSETPAEVVEALRFDPLAIELDDVPSGEVVDANPLPYTAVVAIDLDGTLTEDEPFVSDIVFAPPRPEAVEVLKELVDLNCFIVIFTCRGRVRLVQDYLEIHGLAYNTINENPFQPSGTSAKVMADVYWESKCPGWPGLLGAVADLKTSLMQSR